MLPSGEAVVTTESTPAVNAGNVVCLRTPRHVFVSADELSARLGIPAPTSEQRAIIEAPLSSMLIVAGAGSGKTETMAARVVWLAVNRLVDPEAVLGLTFTRKAARELRRRVSARLASLGASGTITGIDGPPEPQVQTYHGYAAGLLSEYGMLAGLEPNARLLSPAGSWQMAHDVVTSYQGPMEAVDLSPATVTRAVLSLGDELAEHLCPLERAQAWSRDLETTVGGLPADRGGRLPAETRRLLERTAARRQLLGVLDEYRQAKRERGCLDFSDQIALAAHLTRHHPWVIERERIRWDLVLLDEFQDTSPAQLVMLRALFGPDGRAAPSSASNDTGDATAAGSRGAARPASRLPGVPVVAVGDPHQSIYGWRGAGADTLGRFAEAFGGPHQDLMTGWLSTSWRNAERVLVFANQLAAPLSDAGRVAARRLVPAPGALAGQVDVARCADDTAEAALVAEWMAAHLGMKDGNGPSDEQTRPFRDTSTSPSPNRVGESGPEHPPTAAVLCRRRDQIPLMATALRAAGLPVEEVGVVGLLTTPEVAHLVAALTVTHDPARNDAMLQLLMTEPVRLGAADLDAVGAWARELAPRRCQSVTGGGGVSASLQNDAVSASVADDGVAGTSTGTSIGPHGAGPRGAGPRGAGPHGAGPHGPVEEPCLIEAVTTLPVRGWRGTEGQRLGDQARRRLVRLAAALSRIATVIRLPLPDLVHTATRILGLDVEIAARRGPDASAGARHLQRFARAVAEFERSTSEPTLEALLGWLEAAQDEEGGLALDPGPVMPGAVQVSTVHAAKGLEWDIVAVPGLVEGSFPSVRVGGSRFRDGLWAVSRPRDRGWTTDVGALPYDLRADRDALPGIPWREAADLTELSRSLDDFAERNAGQALAEERRLMYVAVTRARRALLMTASIWASGTTPKVTSRFLEELRQLDAGRDPWGAVVRVLAWVDMPGDLAVSNRSATAEGHGGGGEAIAGADHGVPYSQDGRPPTIPPPGAVGDPPRVCWPPEPERQPDVERAAAAVMRWQDGRGEAPHGAPLQADEEFLAVDREIAVLLAEREEAPSAAGGSGLGLPGRLTASALVGRHKDPESHARDVRRPVPRRPLSGGRVGRDWHRWIERYYRHGDLFDQEPNPEIADDVDLLRLTHHADDRPGQVSARAVEAFLATPWARRIPVALELPVDALLGGVPVRGRIDAVFPDGEAGRFVIVDWKTGRPATGEAAAAQALQLAVYRTAFARLVGEPVDHVRACFCYADDGSTVYPPLPEENDLAVFVEAAARL